MNRKRLLFLAGIFLLYVLLDSCGNNKNTAQVIDPMKSEKLTKEALQASWGLLEKGQAMANERKTIKEILKILPDSALVQVNPKAILFFVNGSIPMMIEIPHDNSSKRINKGVYGLRSNSNMVGINSILNLNVEEDELEDIVGNDYSEDRRQEKKALIISPYLEDFGNDDDGLVAKEYLEKNKNYDGRVDFYSDNTTLAVYNTFGDYDLVHLSTHGQRFCNAPFLQEEMNFEVSEDTGDIEYQNNNIPVTDIEGNEVANANSTYYECNTIIKTGIEHGLSEDELEEFCKNHPEYSHLLVLTKDEVALRTAYFDFIYGDLQDKIWVFSACELGQNNDLTSTIENILTDSHFFYWLNTVDARDARPAFDKFYKNLVLEGLDAEKSFDKTPESLRTGLDSEIVIFSNGNNDTIAAKTSLLHLKTGEPRHGIEVIEMRHPEEEDQRIRSGDFYPLVGDFGDGEDEALTLKLELKGYTRQEFEDKEMSIGLKVDDEIVLWNKPFLPDEDDDEIEVEDLEDQEYGVEVTIADIAIPDVGDKERITLKAYLHFDDERFSIHKEEVVIKADGIEAIVRGGGKTIRFTYDDKRRTMKIQTSGDQGPMYMDESGYITRNVSNEGWVKINMGGIMGMMGQMPIGPQFNDIPVQDMLEPSNNNFFFPMVEWGIRFRMSAFERNPNFKKQEEDCGKPEPCQRFIGIAGQEQGVRALFEPNGRLKEINFQGNKITYKYGIYNVVIPEAREISIGL